jgi:hypothetical protein
MSLNYTVRAEKNEPSGVRRMHSAHDRELPAVIALSGILLLTRGHPQLDVSAIKSALVWEVSEAGRLQAETDGRQTWAVLALETAVLQRLSE